MPFDLDLSFAQPLLRRAERTFSLEEATNILRVAGERVGIAAEGFVQDSLYPPASGKALPLYYTRQRVSDGPNWKKGDDYRSKFISAAQQRLVMRLAKAGKIPYRRTGQLGRSILSKVAVDAPGAVSIRVGSNLAYAPYVIDQFLQSHYHLGTWPVIQHQLSDHLGALAKVGTDAAAREVQRRLGNG